VVCPCYRVGTPATSTVELSDPEYVSSFCALPSVPADIRELSESDHAMPIGTLLAFVVTIVESGCGCD
jgi:hypothetical protein